MGKYLKKFNSHAEYNAFTATTAFILPNVSLCVNEDDLHYNPLVRVSGVTLDKSELSIKEGDTETLVASILPYNASNKNIVWSSSDDSIATVSSNGTVSGVAFGNADITVTTEDGGYTAQCSTSVKSYKVITYTATAKLPETTSTDYSAGGLHVNSFNGTSGQQLTMDSHTFEDGVGTITFNGDIAKFGNNAFFSATTLASIDIPDSVTSIGERTFQYCSGLTSIEIPNRVTSIGNVAFHSCGGLTSCTIGSGVTSIGNNAFYACGLTSIEIPNRVTSIGSGAFQYCSSLTSCTIGSGVTSIGQGAFESCRSLTSIEIPNRVTSINNNVFRVCTRLTSCTIGSGVTSIGQEAFNSCSSLTSIEIPNRVTSIGEDAFHSCTSLTSCTIGSGVTSIGKRAFSSCTGLTTCTIGSGVTSIGQEAFNFCSSLSGITSNAMAAPTIQNNSFIFVKSGGVLTVPIGSTGYNTWMQNANYYLGMYGWTKVEQ